MGTIPGNEAARWFGVRAEFQPVGRVQLWLHALRHQVTSIVTLGVVDGELDPRRPGRVIVHRRDNGEAVLIHHCDRLSEVSDKVYLLHSRLTTTPVDELCRDLGLPDDVVVGPGTDEPLDPVPWDEAAFPRSAPG